jgi:hypothetical protein
MSTRQIAELKISERSAQVLIPKILRKLGRGPDLGEPQVRMTEGLRSLLETLDPLTRNDLRRVLIHDQADRDAISSQLMRYRDGRGDDWADIIDMLTMDPDARRRVVRQLGENEAGGSDAAEP